MNNILIIEDNKEIAKQMKIFLVNRNDFANIYSKKEISLYEKSLTIYKDLNNDIVPYGNLNTIKKLPGKLKAWYIGGGNCGAIASAISMRYYYDYVNKSYVNSSKYQKIV